LDLDLAAEVAHFFRLTNEQTKATIQSTVDVVSHWQQIAKKYKVSRSELDRMSVAFLNQ
jgi:serine/threonine-protein kinase HipA